MKEIIYTVVRQDNDKIDNGIEMLVAKTIKLH